MMNSAVFGKKNEKANLQSLVKKQRQSANKSTKITAKISVMTGQHLPGQRFIHKQVCIPLNDYWQRD
jgi:hypothetical protein